MPTSSIMRRRRKSRPPSGRIAVLRGATEAAPMMAMAVLEHRSEAGHGLAGCLLVMHQGDADVAFGGVDAGRLAADIGAGQHFYVRLAPQLARRLLAVTDIEPQEEAAARCVVAEAVVQDLLGDPE